jgi:hypothetical protein
MPFSKNLAAMAILAIATSAAAEVPSTPLAEVQGSSITHPAERITVRVPASASYVGSERFNLYGVADAEVHVFAETDGERQLKRLWWVQFESYLPSPMNHRYNYADDNRPIEIGGVRTWLRSGPVSTAAPTRAGSDREHVIAILKRAGVSIPSEVMNVRLVQLLDDPDGTGRGTRELMIIYSEDLAQTGKTLGELSVDGKPNDLWPPIEDALISRATGSVSIERR